MIPALEHPEAERTVLGAVLVEPKEIATAADRLLPKHFADRRHVLIFEAMCAMFDRGDVMDPVTLSEELGEDLPSAGGKVYIAQLMEGVPRITNLEQWIGIVRERARRRAAWELCRRFIQHAEGDQYETAALLDSFRASFDAVCEADGGATRVTMPDGMKRASGNVEAFQHSGTGIIGVPLGLPDVDLTFRGFQRGKLVIIAGRPGDGKSSMLAQLALWAAMHGHRGLVFSMEMEPEEMIERMWLSEANVERWDVRGHRAEEAWEKLGQAYGRLAEIPLEFDRRERPTLTQIRAATKAYASTKGCDFVCVDYLQRVPWDTKMFPQQRDGVGSVVLGLKSLARAMRIPVIVACQLNRDAQGNEPTLRDLAQSGQIEQEADIVLALHPEAETKGLPVETSNLITLKHRGGETRRWKVGFEKRFTRFLQHPEPARWKEPEVPTRDFRDVVGQ